ncbi:HAMP domain-containing histidine kinase [Oxalobacteraceae bacterium OM1]|nr:HAMP domain-containing histidine kinase [Oxalobacteraceae bacterium OM1]
MEETLLNEEKMAPERAADLMLRLRDTVLNAWAERVRAEVREAQKVPHPILINTFPALYAELAAAVAASDGAALPVDSTIAAEHGGERARLTSYNAHAVIFEYQLLRSTIFDVLRQHGVQLDNIAFAVMNARIDRSIGDAVGAFALTQAALRERLMNSLTHDLRNPLANAMMAADMIERIDDPAQMKALARRATANLSRMDGMLRQLLDAAAFHGGEPVRLALSEFDILALAEEVSHEFAALHGPRFQAGGEAVEVVWDRDAVKRALENLFGNAVKYGRPGGMVAVTVRTQHGRVTLTVHNEGEPIAPEQVESIFQVFRRAVATNEEAKEGWGIGLPYVRAVAESHGGSVGVANPQNGGTAFILDVPRDARPFAGAPTL